MPPRHRPDPFTDHPLRPPPTTNPALRAHSSQSTRSNASTASTRTRQPHQRDNTNNLFAPALSRRPTSRNTPRLEDEVLADPDSEDDGHSTAAAAAAQPQKPARRTQPTATIAESRYAGGKLKANGKKEEPEVEEAEIVNRQPDGAYLVGESAGQAALAQHLLAPELEAERQAAEIEAGDAENARSFFISGTAVGGRGKSKMEEEYEGIAPAMMIRLREQAMRKIEEERWMFEGLDRYRGGLG